MKYFEIQESKVMYLKSDGRREQIDKITKEDLLMILNEALKSDFEFDDYQESLIANQVHNIIYSSIHKKLIEYIANKDIINNEVNSLYESAFEKYCKVWSNNN